MSDSNIIYDQADATVHANAPQPLRSDLNGTHSSTLRSSSGHEPANKPVVFEESPRLGQVAAVPAQFVSGANLTDTSGNSVDRVYFKRGAYAIYRTGEEVLVVYSKNGDIASKQIATLSGLLPLRDQLINLIRDVPQDYLKKHYRAQIADALRLGLEGQVDCGRVLLNGAVNDARENLTRAMRQLYLKCAAGIALSAAMTVALGIAYVQDTASIHLALLAIGAGTIGVLLSIAIAIRSRTVVIDGNRQANIIDAALRMLIGAISAAVLFLLVNSGALVDIQFGAAKLVGPDAAWQAMLLLGFMAGFFERLVPDLLEKAAPAQGTSS
jgi:hypothetical protein